MFTGYIALPQSTLHFYHHSNSVHVLSIPSTVSKDVMSWHVAVHVKVCTVGNGLYLEVC